MKTFWTMLYNVNKNVPDDTLILFIKDPSIMFTPFSKILDFHLAFNGTHSPKFTVLSCSTLLAGDTTLLLTGGQLYKVGVAQWGDKGLNCVCGCRL